MTAPTRSRRHDEGSALVMVLVFVLVVAVIIGALLNQSFTTYRTARVAAEISNRVFAANGGAEWGVQQIRQGVTVGDEPACATPSGSPTPLGPPLQLDGRTVTVTCQVDQGGSVGAGGWAAFITDASPAGGISVQSGTDSDKVVYGPVYNLGPLTRIGTPTLRVQRGDLFACGGTAPFATVAATPFFAVRPCGAPLPIPPAPVPVESLPSRGEEVAIDDTYTDVSPTCRVFNPGRYSRALAFRTTGTNYLRSGIYYFDNLDFGTPVVHTDVTVLGGIAGPREQGVLGLATKAQDDGCPVETAASTGDHYGVVLVLGVNTRVEFQGRSHVELFGYANTAVGAGSLSVVQLRNEWGPTEVSAVRGPDQVIFGTGLGSQTELVAHGTVYTPLARVTALGTATSRVSFLGGVVAAGLDLQAGAATDGLHVSNQSGPGSRTIRIVSTTNSVGTEKILRTSAVVEVSNDASRTANVTSWVVEQ